MDKSNIPSQLLKDIKYYLPDTTEQEAINFTYQVSRLQKLQQYCQKYNEDLTAEDRNTLARAEKALDYQRAYRIAVIGTTGAGKSTLLNSIIGRQLVLTKPVGKPATGAALEIFLDVPETGQEKAQIIYRNQANIRSLLADFIQRYQINLSWQTIPLDATLASYLRELKPTTEPSEQAQKQSQELAKALADIVSQYVNYLYKSPRQEFSLSNDSDIQELMEIIDENSPLNSENSPARCIGLIKTVIYHIKANSLEAGIAGLKLPPNVCLVDLPGLDGSPLHDIIIVEEIKEADAVIFVLRPPRILGRGDAYLLDRVRKYIGLEGHPQSGDRIFLVLNARDSIMVDTKNTPSTLPQDMADFMNLLMPGYKNQFSNRGGEYPYFLTSAWAAYCAQKQLQGKTIDNPNTYESIKIKLGLKDSNAHTVLVASQIPKLVQEITTFAREHRIEGQIRDGQTAISNTDKAKRNKPDKNNRCQFFAVSAIGRYKKDDKWLKAIEEIQLEDHDQENNSNHENYSQGYDPDAAVKPNNSTQPNLNMGFNFDSPNNTSKEPNKPTQIIKQGARCQSVNVIEPVEWLIKGILHHQ